MTEHEKLLLRARTVEQRARLSRLAIQAMADELRALRGIKPFEPPKFEPLPLRIATDAERAALDAERIRDTALRFSLHMANGRWKYSDNVLQFPKVGRFAS
jgi:hypothetical protein